jgi:hypothetical protein
MRRGDLTEKNMQVLRDMEYTKTQRERRVGTLKDYSLKHRVSIHWDLNEDARRERMFKLKVGDNEVILDAEEIMRYLRWV